MARRKERRVKGRIQEWKEKGGQERKRMKSHKKSKLKMNEDEGGKKEGRT